MAKKSKILQNKNIQKIQNKGYSDAGASKTKKSMKGFTAKSGSPREDIDFNNFTLRQRSRMLYMAAPIATSAVKTNRTNVIGIGLRLQSRINKDILGFSKEQAEAWQKKTEAEFELWASNKRHCDATGLNDFYAIQQLALVSWLISGDCFAVIKRYPTTTLLPYSLRLHIVEADRVSTPGNSAIPVQTTGKSDNGNTIYDGVEIDNNGLVQAYHICNKYPFDSNVIDKTEWSRVEAYGAKTGLANILHIMDSERPDQYRGVPYLAHVIEPLLQLRRYTESELMAALVNSFFTAFVKTESDPADNPFNETNEKPEDQVSEDDDDYELGPGTVNIMKPGESVEFGDPKHPNSGFDTFMRSMAEICGAALEVPADLLLKAFNASYSASRAALLEAWKAFKMRREWFQNDFCKPSYELFLDEAVARGRIIAPGFLTNPLIRSAYLGSEWVGPSQGQLDPVKEITAEILACGQGFSTREQSTIRLNGGQWESNVEQLKTENEKLSEANALLPDNQNNINNTIKDVVINAIKEETLKHEEKTDN